MQFLSENAARRQSDVRTYILTQNRVTGLGEFLHVGRLFTQGSFF
jgi:hypothetical protein